MQFLRDIKESTPSLWGSDVKMCHKSICRLLMLSVAAQIPSAVFVFDGAPGAQRCLAAHLDATQAHVCCYGFT